MKLYLDTKIGIGMVQFDIDWYWLVQIGTRTRPEFRSGTGSGGIWEGTGSGPVPVYLAGTIPVPHFFSCWIIGFLCFALICYLHHVPPPVPRLDHVHLSSSQTVSCATLQFPDCIMRYPPDPSLPIPWLYHVLPPIPRLYHVLPSSSQNLSRVNKVFTFY